MAASTADHSQVKLLAVPEGAKVGDRVAFGSSVAGEPSSSSQMAKKKIWEKLAPKVTAGREDHDPS